MDVAGIRADRQRAEADGRTQGVMPVRTRPARRALMRASRDAGRIDNPRIIGPPVGGGEAKGIPAPRRLLRRAYACVAAGPVCEGTRPVHFDAPGSTRSRSLHLPPHQEVTDRLRGRKATDAGLSTVAVEAANLLVCCSDGDSGREIASRATPACAVPRRVLASTHRSRRGRQKDCLQPLGTREAPVEMVAYCEESDENR